ncbi:MAG TPA: ABC transporter ATP-binding protein [Acidimicrobiales bacterium]|nr:ABC transporter ATP-binding protein [Acidimicrobiales bacterium]
MTSPVPPLPPPLLPPPPPPPIIAVDHVSKWFGDLVAVSDVTFAIGSGVTALLGPNGAGKSTLIRMLCGLTAPAQGTVRVLGRDPRRDTSLARRLGLVPQQESLFDVQTAFEFVQLTAILQHCEDPPAAAARALALVELDPQDTRLIAAYSKGMRQRVKIAQAVVHDPSVLVLDEPLTGLDPRQRLHIIDLVHSLGQQGKCVVVSSHVLDEVERFGSRVLVIVQGRLAAEGDFRAIRELMEDRPLQIRVRSDRPRAIASRLVATTVALAVRVEDDAVIVDTDEVGAFRRALVQIAREENARLFEVRGLDDDLESVFRYLVEARR